MLRPYTTYFLRLTLFLAFFFHCTLSLSQTVGVVFSGGGAKGLYHVGILKALEDNDIPIDYISGTSMGSIVSGMYAAGYSPDEMLRFFITDSVQTWLSGNVEADHKYYFNKFEPTPEVVSIRINTDGDVIKGLQLPVNLISPHQLDLAFINMLQGASWSANENFDSLMIPFRCVATDTYNKKSITFKTGNLPFALRASMAIPFIFKPVLYDSLLLYDGGIIDNFPYNALIEDFNPDVLIGGVCVENLPNPAKNNLLEQLMVMIVDSTKYTLPRSSDILIKHIFNDVSTLDYEKASYIMIKGYEDAMKQMPQILNTIKRRVSKAEITKKRREFKSKIKPLIFNQITINGLKRKQKNYILKQLGLQDPNTIFTYEYLRKQYLKVLASGHYDYDFPIVTYNPITNYYGIEITMSTKPSIKISLGGNISSNSLNQGYVAISYKRIDSWASNYYLQGYFGTFLNRSVLGVRYDLFYKSPLFVELETGFEQYDYNNNNMISYYRNKNFRYTSASNYYASASLVLPILTNIALRNTISYQKNTNRYFSDLHTTNDVSDKDIFKHLFLKSQIHNKRMNYVLHPNEGFNMLLSVNYIFGVNHHTPGTISSSSLTITKPQWFEIKFSNTHYYYINKWFNLGIMAEAVFSNQPSFPTPLMTAITAPAFTPTVHSNTLFMPEYRSAQYIAGGLMPSFKFSKNNKFYLNTYAYCFIPNNLLYNADVKSIKYIFGATTVYQTPIGTASFTVAKYTTGSKNWAFVFNFGYAIFENNNTK